MNTKSFIILVTKAPFESANAFHALQFCKAAIEMGHHIQQVFFYQSGVQNASFLQVPVSDQINLYQAWCELNQQHNVALNVCISAASRRGVVDKLSTESPEHFNVADPFQIVGISDYFAALDSKVISIQL